MNYWISERSAKEFALCASLFNLIFIGVYIFAAYDTHIIGITSYRFYEMAYVEICVDRVVICFYILTNLLFFLAVLLSYNAVQKNQKFYYVLSFDFSDTVQLNKRRGKTTN